MAIPYMFGSEVHLTLLFSLVFKNEKSGEIFFKLNYYHACYRTNAFANCAQLRGGRGNNVTIMINANIQRALRSL